MQPMAQDEQHDEKTGEIIVARTVPFSHFVTRIHGGDFHAALTEGLGEIGAALNQHFQDYRGEPKAQIDITLKFQLKKGVVEVIAEHKIKMPKVPSHGGVFYIDAANRLVEDDPRQISMGFPRTGPRAV